MCPITINKALLLQEGILKFELSWTAVMYSEDLMINEKTQTLHIISNGSIIAVKIKKVFILSFIYALYYII